MGDVDTHAVVGEALRTLASGLEPFVARVFADLLPAGTDWTAVIRAKDEANGRRVGEYASRDVALLLRSMTERLGSLGFPFTRHMPRQAESYARELRSVRNNWAHNGEFTPSEAYRALDSVELLLRAVGAEPEAGRVCDLKRSVSPLLSAVDADASAQTSARSSGKRPVAPSAPSPVPPRIEIVAVSDLSYAMAHCRIPVIDHITVDNPGEDLHGAVVEVDVLSEDGSHGGPREVHLDLAAGKPTVLRTVDLKLDPASMLAVDEQRPGDIRVVLRDARGAVLAEATKEVNILAAKQWKANPIQLGLEMLAAYVQPNASVVSELLTDVSNRLGAATGNSSIDGYQSENPARVDAIARAVFDAMRARDIRYAEPPASWGDDGQKVRTPYEVLDGRLGTCLDTTVTMAAILEQAGINATIWIVRGHAFLGYWRVDSSMGTVSTIEPADVVNQVDLGNIALVETTLTTQSVDRITFEEAQRLPRIRHLEGDLSAIIGVTDIRQAREAKIYPVPSRRVDADGNVIVTQYEPGTGRVVAPYVPSGPIPGASKVDDAPLRIKKWKNALLDLSLRNRLINYTDRSGYRVEVPGPVLGRFEDEINGDTAISLVPSDQIKSVDAARGIRFGRDLSETDREVLLVEKRSAYVDVTEAAYKTRLRQLAYKAKTIMEETGSNNLYLAFGMLHWHVNDRELRSPLVLVPVRLATANKGDRYTISLDDAGTSTPNYCLVEKLRIELGLEIPGLANPSEDGSGIDLDGTFTAVRQAISEKKLGFRVEESVHLSILQFAKFPLWKDLDEHWRELTRNPLVTHLVETPGQQFVDPVGAVADTNLDELGMAVPVPADSSQLRAVSDAVAGRTFVLEGPPGTGKSQTITNLLAHAMASGKRVLFVAEKRAALDVVKKRLEAVGLGELSLDLHDKSARPAAVRAQISAALDHRVNHDPERLTTGLQSAESSRDALARYAARLHEENAAHLSLYTARRQELAADQDVEPLEVPRALVAGGSEETFALIDAILRGLPAKADLARPRRNHPWRFIDEVPSNGLDAAKIHADAVEFDSALAELDRSGLDLDKLAAAPDTAALVTWAQLDAEPRVDLAVVDALHAQPGRSQVDAIVELVKQLAGERPDWMSTFDATAVDLDIPKIHEAAVAADESGFFGRKKRRRAVLEQLSGALAVEATAVKLKELSTLAKGIAGTHAVVTDLRARVAALPVVIFDGRWNPLVSEDSARLSTQLAALRRVGDIVSVNPGDPLVGRMRDRYRTTTRGQSGQALQRLATAWHRFAETVDLDPTQRQAWLGDDDFFSWWGATRGDRKLETSASIERWVDLVTHVEPLKTAGLDSARVGILSGSVVPEDATLAFARGAAVASIGERLDATVLGDFDVNAHNKTIGRFTKNVRQIRSELHRALPARLLAERTFDSEATIGQIGLLKRQLNAKRGGMSIRKLMETYGDLISEILPCTLMSPDSVARFFPAKSDFFDIVVFDEASQIRVADAVGAMGRAKSVVVVGDSKQMPPTSFAETNAVSDDEVESTVEAVVDEESILTECVQALVPQQWLSWHYRSQDEALIAFSNLQYYQGKLASFPAPLLPEAGHGISLVRVDGHFERAGKGKTLRTNRVEAERIVVDVRQRFADSPHQAPSIGVITFNSQQRDLIENMLRDAGDDRLLRALDETDGLFVKNLENVQGDERDTILFSVAFSRNDKGVVPLNFGPLSRPGGERRLNVAITRARREVVLYSSFDPAELRAEETAQVGTKHLKEYLELAASGVETITSGGRRQPVFDRHRDDIASALRAEGLEVATDVGLSDFRVDIVIADPDQPDRPLVAVLLDGVEWFGRPTVADRDGLPVEVLENLMDWPAVERVWMPEWLNHRAETITRLRAAVIEAKEGLNKPKPELEPAVVDASTSVAERTDVESIEGSSQRFGALKSAPTVVAPKPSTPKVHPDVTEYRAWTPYSAGDKTVLDELRQEWAASRVKGMIQMVIEAEAPIHQDRLAKLVAAAFGLGRVNEERKRSIRRLVPAEFQRRNGDGFYWPVGVDPESWRLVRRSAPGDGRVLEEVSLVEIGNAMRVVAEQSGGIDPEELKREALAMFGGKRRTPAITARLDAALVRAFSNGVLQQHGSGLVRSGIS